MHLTPQYSVPQHDIQDLLRAILVYAARKRFQPLIHQILRVLLEGLGGRTNKRSRVTLAEWKHAGACRAGCVAVERDGTHCVPCSVGALSYPSRFSTTNDHGAPG